MTSIPESPEPIQNLEDKPSVLIESPEPIQNLEDKPTISPGYCCVRFEYDNEYQIHVHNQPLYYLAENYKQYLMSTINSDFVDNAKIDVDLQFPLTDTDTTHYLQLSSYDHDKIKNKVVINYFIDRITSNTLTFTYKGVSFSIKPLESCINTPIKKETQVSYTILSYYGITFEKKHFALFEEFIIAANKYHEKFLVTSDNDDNKVNIYINENDGAYFEFISSRSKRSLDTIYLPSKKKNDIIKDLTHFLLPETKERYGKLGITYKRIYLFEGVPGSGKTSFILALASQFNYDIAIISFGPKFKDTDLLRILRNFDRDHKTGEKKKLLILEDMDCIFKERKSNDESRNMVSFSGLLNALDGITTPDNFICFITTNYKQNLDTALIRPGRVDYIMNFDYVVAEQVIDIFNVYMSNPAKEVTTAFHNALKGLNNIYITVSLLQQYLFKYLDNATLAIDNIDELKQMYTISITDKGADGSGLFS